MPSSAHGWERRAYAGVWVTMLATVVAAVLGRMLAVGLGVETRAPGLTIATILVMVAAAITRRRSTPLLVALAMAPLAGSLLELLCIAPPLLVVAAVGPLAIDALAAALPPRLDGLGRAWPKTSAALILLALLAMVQTSMLATFMADASWTQGALPLAPSLTHHACSTAYVHAAKLASSGVDNIYAAKLWPSLDGAPAGADAYAPFGLDAFAYPPTFLVLMRPLLAVGEFSEQRALWFGLNVFGLAAALLVVVRWIADHDELAGTRAALLALLLWSTPVVLLTLQVGNVHLAVLAAAVVAMICFEQGRPALGGALLAAAILSKISPGLLGIVLLVRKQWRAAAWSAGFGLLWTLAALLLYGPAPFEAFWSYQLPRLSSGEALAFFATNPRDMAINLAPFGLPFKLAALGVEIEDPWAVARVIGTVFTVLVLGATLVAARREGPRWHRVAVWLAVLTLGALRSPFAPSYVGISALWLLCVSSTAFRGVRGAALFVVIYLIMLGVPPSDDLATLLSGLLQQGVLLALLLVAISRRPEASRPAESS